MIGESLQRSSVRSLPVVEVVPSAEVYPEAQEECGFVAVVTRSDNAAEVAIRGVSELDNRGKESTGVIVLTEDGVVPKKGFGTGRQIFEDSGVEFSKNYPGRRALAHARYGTQGTGGLDAAQPHYSGVFKGNNSWGDLSHVTNGNIINTQEVSRKFGITSFSSDSELMQTVFAYAARDEIAAGREVDLTKVVRETLPSFDGAYSGAVLLEDQLVAYCDPYGLKPSVVGRLPDGGIIIASEVTALDANSAEFLFEMQPGQLVTVDKDMNIHTEQWTEPKPKGCLLEVAYFIRALGKKGTEAVFRGVNVAEARRAFGRELAEVLPVKADLVVGVPNSAVIAGQGYAEGSGTPYKQVLEAVSADRSFIEPTQELRKQAVEAKIRVNSEQVDGKSLVVVEDSLIRGTTMWAVVNMLRKAGAAEVHVRIALDRYEFICQLGVDTGRQEELLASFMTDDEIAQYINADSIAFLPVERIKRALGQKAARFCMGCLTGDYPVTHEDSIDTPQKELVAVS